VDAPGRPPRARRSRRLRLARAAELFGADLRSLAVFRIGLALAVLADLGIRAADLRAHYTDAGVLSRPDLLTLFDWLHAWPLCLHLAGGSAWSQAVFFAGAAVAALALLVGHRTTLATVVLWFLTASLQLRNLFIGAGYDALLRLLLLWGCFLPLGARWSLDAGRADPSRAPPTRVLCVGTIALLVQVLIVYWSAAVGKWDVAAWRDGTALATILDDDFRTTAVGGVLGRYPDLVRLLGHAVVGLELAGPALLLAPIATGPLRTAAIAALCAMNLGFGLCLELGLFPWVSSVALLGLLPGWFWDRLGSRPASAVATDVAPSTLPRRRVADAVCAILLAYVVAWSVGVARDPGYRAPDAVAWLGSSLFLQQDWRMFAVPASRTGWVVVPGRLLDGTALDLFAGGGRGPRVGADAAPPAVGWERPARPAGRFANDRWRLFVARAVYGSRQDAQLLAWGRFLCREWNAAHENGRRLEGFEVVFMVRSLVPGDPRSYQKEVIWSHRCFA
jgi:hypothetical protein